MLLILGIFLGVIALSAGFSVLGARIGSQMEARSIGAGTTELSIKSGMTANLLGAILGMIPFMIFVIVLIVMVITSPAEHVEGAPGGAPAAAAH
jgi:hypothetical protein